MEFKNTSIPIAAFVALCCGTSHAMGQVGHYTLDATNPSDNYDVFMGGSRRIGVDADATAGHIIHAKYDATGKAVATGDFNGDGIQDFLISADNSMTDPLLTGTNDRLGHGAGKIYIIYGGKSNDAPGRILDNELKRYGAASYPPQQSTVGQDQCTPPWYNLFDVPGERRFLADDTNTECSSSLPEAPELRGAVLYSEKAGYKNNTHVDPDDLSSPKYRVLDLYKCTVIDITDDAPYGFYATSTEPLVKVVTAANSSGDLAGYAVSNAGDVNGDGIDDFLIGAPLFRDERLELDQSGLGLNSNELGITVQNEAGCVYLIFGSETELAGALSLAEVGNSIPGVKFIGSGLHAKLGQDVRNASSLEKADPDGPEGTGKLGWSKLDFNNDGLADFVIGSQSLDAADVFPYFNSPQANGPRSINDPDGNEQNSDGTAPSGDALDHDTTRDILGRDSGAGACMIVYGRKADSMNPVNPGNPLNPWALNEYCLPRDVHTNETTDSLPGTSGQSGPGGPVNLDGHLEVGCLIGDQQYGYLGYAGFAGDFDGDGFADIAISAPHHTRNPAGGGNHSQEGELYILFGSDEKLTGVHMMRDLMGKNRDSSAIANNPKTRAISIIGEMNTLNDFEPLTQFHIANAELNSGSDMGWSTMAAGDVNGDGFTDVLVSADDRRAGTHGTASIGTRSKGKAYLVYGFSPAAIANNPKAGQNSADPFKYSVEELRASGTSLATFMGEFNGDATGQHVFCAGDVDQDGFADFLICAPWANRVNPSNSAQVFKNVGAVYLIYGSASGLFGDFELSNVGTGSVDEIRGAVFYGDHRRQIANPGNPDIKTNAGTWAVGGSDLDGDGVQDLMIGVENAARSRNSGGNTVFDRMGAAFVVYGQYPTIAMDVNKDGTFELLDYSLYVLALDETGVLDLESDHFEPTYRYNDLNHDGVRDLNDANLILDEINSP